MKNRLSTTLCAFWAFVALLSLLPVGLRAQTAGLRERQAVDTLLAAPSARARFVSRATLYGVGAANMYDTYLSPQEYRGVEVRVLRENLRFTPWGDGKWSRQVLFQGYVNYTHNHVDNNNSVGLLGSWGYGVHRHFRLTPNFRLLAGGMADLNGGFLWNMRNGNNPASARAYVNLGVSGMAVWDLKIRRYPIRLRYQLNVPLAGVMFSPHYGQSYYEIFSLGNAGGVVRFTSLHNQPSLRQLLTVDLPARRAKLRLAYVWDAQQSSLNDIRTHAYSHVFMVGLVREFYLLRGRR